MSIPGEPELGEQYLIEMIDPYIEGDLEDYSVEDPISFLVSSVLPEKSGKVSNLNF